MIYTLTFNPAVDYVMHIDALHSGEIIRSFAESICFGGKGINVSLILQELGISSVALGFVGGFTGAAIEDTIKSDMIKTDFVKLEKGISRINVKLRSDVETDINGCGPEITSDDIEKLFKKLDNVKSGDYLIVSGSVPKGIPFDIYEKIMHMLYERNVKFAVDAEGDLLMNTLRYNPFVIKPNNEELGKIFKVQIDTIKKAEDYAVELKKMGAQNVIVSMGSKGAVLVDEFDNIHYNEAHKGNVINTVGAGDSMVAGFVAGYSQTGDYNYALKLGTAAGSATAFTENLATKEEIYNLIKANI